MLQPVLSCLSLMLVSGTLCQTHDPDEDLAEQPLDDIPFTCDTSDLVCRNGMIRVPSGPGVRSGD